MTYGFYWKLQQQGFEELYFEADYYWGVVNKDTNRIVTYTEGDIYDKTHTSAIALLKDTDHHINFLKKQGYSEAVYGEYQHVRKSLALNVLISLNEEKTGIVEQLGELHNAGDFYSIPAEAHKERLREISREIVTNECIVS